MGIFEDTSSFGQFGRSGRLTTRRGVVSTPTFMPDGTRGAVKGLTPQQVADTGVEVVLANTYHLHLAPGEQAIAELGGLHKFANRSGPMLTDSGGFQVFSLGKHVKISEDGVEFRDPKSGDKHFISPEKSIQIQLDLGADMIVAFDHLIGLDEVSSADVKDAFDRTHRWLERCIVEFRRLTKDMIGPEDPDYDQFSTGSEADGKFRRPLLFGVVQGGLDLDLRKKSLEIVQNSGVDGVAIGGLSVGETREEMAEVLQALAPLYRADLPRFLLGVGTPEDLKIAVENGIDMLDCVLPTRNARHASVWRRKHCDCTNKLNQVELDGASSAISAKNRPKSSRTVPDVRLAAVRSDFDETSLKHSTSEEPLMLICKKCKGLCSERIHLTNERFALDSSPIDEFCDCFTCKSGFSKAFLRHQFKSGDPLAGTLASIHNLRHMIRLCENYR